MWIMGKFKTKLHIAAGWWLLVQEEQAEASNHKANKHAPDEMGVDDKHTDSKEAKDSKTKFNNQLFHISHLIFIIYEIMGNVKH